HSRYHARRHFPTNGAAYPVGPDIKKAQFYSGLNAIHMNDFHAKRATPPKPFRNANIQSFKVSTFST
ncbi:hypothetical protein, partial [Pseudomonas syringae group genomosp. 7]|uniref:hypothetical protein n=1 Tax=Pseudomonas syringae group genomosp. 7 TaxID=251699 RepID=UPI0037703887